MIEALAHVEQVAPDDFDYQLHEYVNTDALLTLGNCTDATWELSFEVPDHGVRITSDGSIFVDGNRIDPTELTSPWAR